MITAGVDIGTKNTKTILMRDGKVIGRATVLTGLDPKGAAGKSLEAALKNAGLTREDIQNVAGTGSGKGLVAMAGIQVNEIEAMAVGAHHLFPAARTVADVGAEEGRAAKIDENGNVEDFVINEKCAAGAGVFIEGMARALEVSLEEMGTLCLDSQKDIPMNAQCVIFAECEVVGLIHAGTAKSDISRAIHDAMVGRIISMVRRVGVSEDVVLMGGVGRNPGFVNAMKRGLSLQNLHIPEEPEYGAAIGAAVVAARGA